MGLFKVVAGYPVDSSDRNEFASTREREEKNREDRGVCVYVCAGKIARPSQKR